jgi:DNA ligase (NAD+)
MYSKETTQQLQKQAVGFIKNIDGITKKEIEGLRDVLRFHEHRYYILNDPLISDFEYDQLFKALEKLEAENPSLISSD